MMVCEKEFLVFDLLVACIFARARARAVKNHQEGTQNRTPAHFNSTRATRVRLSPAMIDPSTSATGENDVEHGRRRNTAARKMQQQQQQQQQQHQQRRSVSAGALSDMYLGSNSRGRACRTLTCGNARAIHEVPPEAADARTNTGTRSSGRDSLVRAHLMNPHIRGSGWNDSSSTPTPNPAVRSASRHNQQQHYRNHPRMVGNNGRNHSSHIVSPFRIMETTLSTSPKLKAVFGLAVIAAVVVLAPLELQRMQNASELERSSVGGRGGGGGNDATAAILSDASDGPDDTQSEKQQISKEQLQQQQEQKEKRTGRPFHLPSILGPDPGPFASRAYHNIQRPSPPGSLFGRISRRLLNLKLRLSSRRNEHLYYLGAGNRRSSRSGSSSSTDDTGRSEAMPSGGSHRSRRQERRERRHRRRESRQKAREARQSVVMPYKILDAEELYHRMIELTERYPNLVRLENAQQMFGLPAAGGPKDCAFEASELGDGCHNWYLVLEDWLYNANINQNVEPGLGLDFSTESAAASREDDLSKPDFGDGGDGSRSYSQNGESSRIRRDPYGALPEVILSGALHGDERVGPTAVVELASVLLESAYCESLPRTTLSNTPGKKNTEDSPSRRVKMANRKAKDRQYSTKKHAWKWRKRKRKPSRTVVDEEEIDLEEREFIENRKRQRRDEIKAQRQSCRFTAASYYSADEIDKARACRSSLSNRGISGPDRRWLARLVSTRRIVIVPAANALGYARGTREEDYDLDPNRDFPYDLTHTSMCMRTIAGRTMNELFRQHIFQMGITFHGGMEAIAYEWGAPSYILPRMGIPTADASASAAATQSPARPSHAAPDSISQMQISQVYSSYGGKAVKDRGDQYPVGSMNDLVYPVRGGMEDWSYAASFDTDRIVKCSPKTYGGYAAEKTMYGSANLRTFNALVETSNDKTPRDEDLGTNEDLLTPFGAGNGHISRNIRLGLALVDLVEPYVQILDVAGQALKNDIIPMSRRGYRSSSKTKVVAVPQGTRNVTVGWTVGGAISVDSTSLMVARWDDLDENIFDGITQPTKQELDQFFSVMDGPPVWFSDAQGPGPAKWKYLDSSPLSTPSSSFYSREGALIETVYRAEIDLSSLVEGQRIAVYAIARVDQSWLTQEDNVMGSIKPQSNLVNARSNPEWFQELFSDDGIHKTVQGRLDWFSIPLTIEVVGETLSVQETSKRSPDDEWSQDLQVVSSHGIIKTLLFGVALVIAVAACVLVLGSSNEKDCFAATRARRRMKTEPIPNLIYRDPNQDERCRQRRLRAGSSPAEDDEAEDDMDYAIS